MQDEKTLSEKELRLLTGVLMKNPAIQKLWWRWKKTDELSEAAIVAAFDGGYVRVSAAEVRDLLYKLSSMADVRAEVNKATNEIFEKLDAHHPRF